MDRPCQRLESRRTTRRVYDCDRADQLYVRGSRLMADRMNHYAHIKTRFGGFFVASI